MAILAAASTGYPNAPVETEGKLTLVHYLWWASSMEWQWQPSRTCGSLRVPPCHTGPTVWITYRAFRFAPEVITACPAGRVPRCSRIFLHSASRAGPAARWMAPSTPPPPSREELAALTIASLDSSVILPTTSSRTAFFPMRDPKLDAIYLSSTKGFHSRQLLAFQKFQ